MQTAIRSALLVVVGMLASTAHAADAKDLVGAWLLDKGENTPKGAVVEFTKDGKLKVSFEIEAQKFNLNGTYKLDGDKLEVTLTGPDGKENKDTSEIKELTKDKLVIVNKDKKETVYKKK